MRAPSVGAGRFGGEDGKLFPHERCECGHCRCDHALGFGHCVKCARVEVGKGRECERYTWPGRVQAGKVPVTHALEGMP